MSSNLLALNLSKTELIILIGPSQQFFNISKPSLILTPTSSAKIFGLKFDNNLRILNKYLFSVWHYHIRDLRGIRHTLDFKNVSTIATSLVQSMLDYCNSLYINFPSTQITILTSLQNALERTVSKTPKCEQISPILKSPHWLKIEQRFQYNITSLKYKVLENQIPHYLHKLISVPSNCNRS